MRYLIGLCAVAALFVASPAIAQQTGEGSAASPSSAGPLPEMVFLPLNKGEMFTLPADVRDVLVANPGIADVVIKTPRLAYVFARAVGDTNVFFLDAEGGQILRLEIHVEPDLSSLRTAFATVMPGEAIEVTATNEQIILSGTVSSAKAAEDARLIARRYVTNDTDLVNMVGIASDQQVLLRVRVAEMQRSVVKELGFDLTSVVLPSSNDTLAVITGERTPGDIALPVTQNPAAFATGFLDIISGRFLLTAVLDVLERQGVVKTLAEPNLTAVSGENANFLAGGEFPVPSGRDQQGNIQVTFRQFGIVLTFTPVVLESGLINLKISSEVSQLSTAGAILLQNVRVPSLTVRRAETTVELSSGGSIVIAGLLQNDITNTIDGFPGLKDIPILGALFRSTAFQKNESELVFAVTAFLVRPVDERSIALPTDGFAPASDFDMYLLGRLHKVYVKPERSGQEALAGGLLGPVGYIME